MANYSLVINSKFQPFSFERYIQPLQMYGAAFKEQQDALNEIDTKASVWENLANEQTDPETYKQYKAFADDLHSQAESISKYGINTSSRQAMLDMRSRYAREITPIEQAYNKRAADIARQQKLSDATGGKTVFTRTAATTSLDDYRKGVEDFGQANLDQIMQESAAGAKAMSARIFSREEEKNAFNGDYYALVQRQGLTPEEATKVLAGSGKYPEFTKYIEDTKSKYNIGDYDKVAQDRIDSAIMQGINAGMVYQENYTPVNNWRGQENLSFDHRMQQQNDAQAFQQSMTNKIPIAGTDYYYDPKTGMKVDKKGAIVGNYKLEQQLLKSEQNKALKREEVLSKVSSTEDAKKLGYKPIFSTQHHHSFTEGGVWVSGAPGESWTGVPHVFNDWFTDTNLIDDSGDFSYKVPSTAYASIVKPQDYSTIPKAAMKEIYDQIQQRGVDPAKDDLQIMRVSGKGSRTNDYDYIVFKKE
jgi:hypothetical protein